MRIHYNDPSLSDAIDVWLQRSNHTGVYWDMATVSSLDSSGTNNTIAISNATIDNNNYAYWVFISLPKNMYTPSTLFKFYSLKIYYSLPSYDYEYLALSNAAFTGYAEDYDYENHGRWMYHLHGEGGGSTGGTYVAPVYLPDGATIKTLWVSTYDSSAVNSISAVLIRTKLGVNETIAEVTSTGSGGYVTYNDTWLGDNALVDNSQYAYFVYWYTPVSTLPIPPTTNDVVPCTIYIDYDSFHHFVHLPVVLR
jgi:hypothetical protein